MGSRIKASKVTRKSAPKAKGTNKKTKKASKVVKASKPTDTEIIYLYTTKANKTFLKRVANGRKKSVTELVNELIVSFKNDVRAKREMENRAN